MFVLPVIADASVVPSCSAGARRDATLVADTNQRTLWLIGGWGVSSTRLVGYLSDVWSFDIVTRMWTWIGGSQSANTPFSGFASRSEAAAWISTAPGSQYTSLTVFGGRSLSNGNDVVLGDMWEISTAPVAAPVTEPPTDCSARGDCTCTTAAPASSLNCIAGAWVFVSNDVSSSFVVQAPGPIPPAAVVDFQLHRVTFKGDLAVGGAIRTGVDATSGKAGTVIVEDGCLLVDPTARLQIQLSGVPSVPNGSVTTSVELFRWPTACAALPASPFGSIQLDASSMSLGATAATTCSRVFVNQDTQSKPGSLSLLFTFVPVESCKPPAGDSSPSTSGGGGGGGGGGSVIGTPTGPNLIAIVISAAALVILAAVVVAAILYWRRRKQLKEEIVARTHSSMGLQDQKPPLERNLGTKGSNSSLQLDLQPQEGDQGWWIEMETPRDAPPSSRVQSEVADQTVPAELRAQQKRESKETAHDSSVSLDMLPDPVLLAEEKTVRLSRQFSNLNNLNPVARPGTNSSNLSDDVAFAGPGASEDGPDDSIPVIRAGVPATMSRSPSKRMVPSHSTSNFDLEAGSESESSDDDLSDTVQLPDRDTGYLPEHSHSSAIADAYNDGYSEQNSSGDNSSGRASSLKLRAGASMDLEGSVIELDDQSPRAEIGSGSFRNCVPRPLGWSSRCLQAHHHHLPR